MPSKKFKRLLELAKLDQVDRRGANGIFPIGSKLLDRKLNTGDPVSFEGQVYYPVEIHPPPRLKEG